MASGMFRVALLARLYLGEAAYGAALQAVEL